jgi:hypothetical protein
MIAYTIFSKFALDYEDKYKRPDNKREAHYSRNWKSVQSGCNNIPHLLDCYTDIRPLCPTPLKPLQL